MRESELRLDLSIAAVPNTCVNRRKINNFVRKTETPRSFAKILKAPTFALAGDRSPFELRDQALTPGHSPKDVSAVSDWYSEARTDRVGGRERPGMPHDDDTPETVFDRHFDDVYRYVAFRLAPDHQAAQDVTQEVFLAALEHWSSFRGDGPVLSWLRGVARHKVADRLRRNSEREYPTDTQALSQLTARGDAEPERRATLLARALAALSDEQVELLEEKYVAGWSVRQIAARCGRTEKAVESALSRARAAFKDAYLRWQALEEDEDERIGLQ